MNKMKGAEKNCAQQRGETRENYIGHDVKLFLCLFSFHIYQNLALNMSISS